VKSLAAHVGGGGGGSERLALAGGRDAKGIDAVLVAAKAL
jgi:alanyl-tRNA synthetase